MRVFSEQEDENQYYNMYWEDAVPTHCKVAYVLTILFCVVYGGLVLSGIIKPNFGLIQCVKQGAAAPQQGEPYETSLNDFSNIHYADGCVRCEQRADGNLHCERDPYGPIDDHHCGDTSTQWINPPTFTTGPDAGAFATEPSAGEYSTGH